MEGGSVNDTQKFIVEVAAGVLAIVIGVLGYAGTPPVLAIGDPLRLILILGGFAVLGVPLNTGLQAARASTAAKLGR
jgi:hypothetical protein